ncbi:MAG: D-alanyl-D-alanine carboxypeptidase [Candidatus Azotimanducaceae bacterium]|jgi:D-alanyl-D-alanine carboxypeptidase
MSNLITRLNLLGIRKTHFQRCLAPKQIDAGHLTYSELDVFQREQFMTNATSECWTAMRKAARNDNIILQLVSAYRSIDYQCNLIKGKIEKGRTIDEILKNNVIPGYSEHHTGRALDLTTPGSEVLEETFEDSTAFDWLKTHAHQYHFRMTYPRDNEYGVNYEPWHWFCTKNPDEVLLD